MPLKWLGRFCGCKFQWEVDGTLYKKECWRVLFIREEKNNNKTKKKKIIGRGRREEERKSEKKELISGGCTWCKARVKCWRAGGEWLMYRAGSLAYTTRLAVQISICRSAKGESSLSLCTIFHPPPPPHHPPGIFLMRFHLPKQNYKRRPIEHVRSHIRLPSRFFTKNYYYYFFIYIVITYYGVWWIFYIWCFWGKLALTFLTCEGAYW